MMTILQFTSPQVTLANSGGKAANLARLTRVGFPVPPGFILTTDAYRLFVEANRLATLIQSEVLDLSAGDPGSLEQASTRIRAAFKAGELPIETRSAIRSAYQLLPRISASPRGTGPLVKLGTGELGLPVAVRSSATTEDLPDLSFAGQQETFLNVIGEAQLLNAVCACWSSLWTARALGYRIRNGIPHAEAALAVVVQAMVQSKVSGVLFTANPLTGLRSEAVVDATIGLGEALVSGQVEPDHYVVDTLSGTLVEKSLGAKQVATRSLSGGGVETIHENPGGQQALSDENLRQLVALGAQVQSEFGIPQDIEWALADDRLHLLQARPITSLFPLPRLSFDPLIVWFSFGAVQGILDPITPLGQDAIQNVMAGAGALFGLRLNPEEVSLFEPAGERIWIKISDYIRHPIGYRTFGALIDYIEPGTGQVLRPLAADPRLGAGTGVLKLSTLRRLAYFALPVLVRLVYNWMRPEKARQVFDQAIETQVSSAQIEPAADRFERLARIVAFMRLHIAGAFSFLLPRFIPIFAPSMGALNLLNKIAGENRAVALEVTRALPNNVTTQMDLALWDAATAIQADAEAERAFRAVDASELAHRYLDGSLPAAAQQSIAHFMEQYGMRGPGEIDFGRPRWREDPTALMHTLKSYLHIDPDLAPDKVFARGERIAAAAIERLATEARSQPFGWLKAKLVHLAARRIRVLMDARESPKFYAVRMMGIARRALLEVGREFVASGTLERPDDLVYLHLSELESLSRTAQLQPGSLESLRELIAGRRAAYTRELRRRQVPRVLVSDGRAFYEGLGAQTDSQASITGSPVSPGVVEGIVHVVLDPRSAQLAPGEILVCPGTDPAWTPLFMAASGLVTEVGGMMTHGSVVAREYGLPAVVGVHQATLRLQNGQGIRLDGTNGVILLLD